MEFQTIYLYGAISAFVIFGVSLAAASLYASRKD